MSMLKFVTEAVADTQAGARRSTTGLSARCRRRVLAYIEDNLGEPITLDDLAGVACMSRFHFARSFKASLGMSPVRYLQARRIEAAKRMLADSDATVADVSHACGFASHSHFTTSFKAATGSSPQAFRRSLPVLIASLFSGWPDALLDVAFAAAA